MSSRSSHALTVSVIGLVITPPQSVIRPRNLGVPRGDGGCSAAGDGGWSAAAGPWRSSTSPSLSDIPRGAVRHSAVHPSGVRAGAAYIDDAGARTGAAIGG